jgi:hypothetical protein
MACSEAIRLVAHVHRVALDPAGSSLSDLESPGPLLTVPVPLIPYVEQIRALRRELARERAARVALQAALVRMAAQLEEGLQP